MQTEDLPLPRRHRPVHSTSSNTNKVNPSILVVGNSNVKGLAHRIKKHGLDAMGIPHSSARIAAITESIRSMNDHNNNPEFLVLHATDIDIHAPIKPVNAIMEDIDNLIRAAKCSFPQSKICLSSAPLYQDMLQRERAQVINDYVHRCCIRDARLLFISNDKLSVWRDGVHLTYNSKDILAKNIVHVTSLVKNNGITNRHVRPAWI